MILSIAVKELGQRPSNLFSPVSSAVFYWPPEPLPSKAMITRSNLLELAKKYHENLPDKIYEYLNGRGIPDVLIDYHLLGWNGWRITIPIFDRKGEVVSFKLAKDPDNLLPGPKMLASVGSSVELYGWEQVLAVPSRIIICEGEFDRLVLEANGFYAATSTSGAGSFRAEWVKDFEPISEIYVCFDRDEAGQRGALRVGRIIPRARIVELPEEVGQGGDVTDFFVRLGRNREDFLKLLDEAKPAPTQPVADPSQVSSLSFNFPLGQRIEHIKRELPIESLIGRYVELRQSGQGIVGLCPFHEDRNPSLAVYPATGTFYCFGCLKHGDVISFLREIEHLSFSQTLDTLDRLISQHGSQPQESH